MRYLFLFLIPCAAAAAPADAVRPLIEKHCARCHGTEQQIAGLNFAKLLSGDGPVRHRKIWARAAELVKGREMPPVQPQPSEEEREQITAGLEAMMRDVDWSRHRNPGSVIAPRLNRAEYDNTIRDLTGLDLRPAAAFPVDPPGESGFDNDREGLFVPPLLLEKYLDAANMVVDEVVAARRAGEAVALHLEIEKMRNTETQGRPKPYGYDLQAVQNTVFEYVKFPRSGTYTFTVRAWGLTNGKGRVPGVALKIDDQPRGQHVVWTTAKEPGTYEFRTFVRRGSRRVSVHFFPYLTGVKPSATGQAVLSLDWVKIGEDAAVRRAEDGSRVFIAAPGKGVTEQQAALRVLERFATRAWRRPVSKAELAGMMERFGQARKEGAEWDESVGAALKMALVSPNFLFRLETTPKPGVDYRLNGYELAARLSYFLWMSTPDDELIEAARRGRLQDAGVVRAQVKRMMADVRFGEFVEHFFPQWLGYAELGKSAQPERSVFPAWNEALGAAMRAEASLFFGELMRTDAPLTGLLDARHTWVNEELAAIYGIQGVKGREMRRVELTGEARGGLLGMPAILTATSLPVRTSPVVRGKWLLETMLGEDLPPPPANAGDLPEPKGELANKTLRQRFEMHRKAPQCASCHNRIDPLGYALENFDGIGRWRDSDNGQPVDAVGMLRTGEKFEGPAGLRRVMLTRKDAFVRSMTARAMQFALGRKLRYYDEPELDRVTRAVIASGYKPSVLLAEIALSYPFRFKRVDSANQEASQ